MNSKVGLLIFPLAIIIVYTTSTATGVPAGKSPPYFVQQPSNGEILFLEEPTLSSEETSIRIPCEAKGHPSPTYFWTKNGQFFNWTSAGNRIFQEHDNGTLKFRVANATDAGQYQCFAKNIWGIATSNSVFLRKVVLGSFTENEPIVKEVIEGQSYHLTCTVPYIYPKSSVTWYKQDSNGLLRIADRDPRITDDLTDTVWFSSISQKDASHDLFYTCLVRSTYRLSNGRLGDHFYTTDKIKLEIIPMNSSSEQNTIAPFEQHTSEESITAISNQTAFLYCIFGGTPRPSITWYKNNRRAKFNDDFTLKDYGKVIEISRVTPTDEANYTCTVSNNIGEPITHSTYLKVLAKPSFIKIPENITIAEDETVEIHCEATGNPTPEIKWIHNGKPLPEAPFNPRRRVSSNSIIIEKLQMNDTGNYGCNATNNLGYVYQDVYLNVSEVTPPIIIDIAVDTETVENSEVRFPCYAKGFPKPDPVTWFKDDTQLTSNEWNRTIDEDGALLIGRASFTDAGKYTCSVQNRAATVNASANLVVRQRTEITVAPSNIEVTEGETATFRCSAQADPSLELTIKWLQNETPINYTSQPRFVQANDNSLIIRPTIRNDDSRSVFACIAETRLDKDKALARLIVRKPKKAT